MSIRNRIGKLEKVSFSGEPDWCPQFETDASGSLVAGSFPEVGMMRLVRKEGEEEADFRNRIHLETSKKTAGMPDVVYRRLTTVTLEGCLRALEIEIANHYPNLLAELKVKGDLNAE
ncbi:hypothetical protein [Ruegeria atlantica]|uniref:hypothetical protein n=1 Tax=Ruegeria atlantica TaxID=81569 RepID=UPI001479B111|nr:hypothetical protein [Ruegeria atlantica]